LGGILPIIPHGGTAKFGSIPRRQRRRHAGRQQRSDTAHGHGAMAMPGGGGGGIGAISGRLNGSSVKKSSFHARNKSATAERAKATNWAAMAITKTKI